MKKLLIILITSIACSAIQGQSDPAIDSLFRNSYRVFELQRLPNGMYRDAKLFAGTDYHPISVSNTGMGLISLCIADSMAWIDDAREQALNTLKSITGHTAGFKPDRTSNGYFRHFLNVSTGAREWDSEYSTIDTDILMAGALFARNYFRDETISLYVAELWNSIDFEAAIADPTAGHIYLSMNVDGTGIPGSFTLPYNEYMIVAWLAMNASDSPTSSSQVLWDNFYSAPASLTTLTYAGISLLSDNPSSYLSSFVHQFNYYLCHYFTTSEEYLAYFKNAQLADSAWWNSVGISNFEWGHGAGSALSTAYHADAINNNSDTIVSPHIIAGFIPVNPDGKNDLAALWENNKGKYFLPTADSDPVLWRYRATDASWTANEIIGVDHSSMLFGISVLPEYLGSDFFSKYNKYLRIPAIDLIDLLHNQRISVSPNPFTEELRIELENECSDVRVKIIDYSGQTHYQEQFHNSKKPHVLPLLSPGIYILIISGNGLQQSTKIIKQ